MIGEKLLELPSDLHMCAMACMYPPTIPPYVRHGMQQPPTRPPYVFHGMHVPPPKQTNVISWKGDHRRKAEPREKDSFSSG